MVTPGTDLEHAPAVDQITANAELAVRQQVDLDMVARLGMWLAAAESNSNDPKAKGMAAALRIAYADRLGLPAHAASEIHLVKGNLTLSAKLCRALAHQHGLRVIKVDEKADSVTAAVIDQETGAELGRSTYTLAMAKKAGLSGTNWTNHPDRMLWARASKRCLDDFAPWVTVGVLLDDETQEFAAPAPVVAVVPDPVADVEPDYIDADDIPFGDAA